MSRRGRRSSGRVASQPRASTAIGTGEVELLMDCVDEDLTPCQKAAYKKAEQAYRAAMDRIASAKANSQGGNVSIQYVAAGSLPPPPPSPTVAPAPPVAEEAAPSLPSPPSTSSRPTRRAARKAGII